MFKIGERVRVRRDLNISERYYGENGVSDTVTRGMKGFGGKTVTISSQYEDGYGFKYFIKEDGEQYFRVDGMFERIKKFYIDI